MRTAFIDQLIKEARVNDKIFLLVGDLGYNVVEPFAKEFPDRFQNVGIAEQNMAGLAAGLAMTGYNVYFYSIGNFPTLRCIEQIRNDICYHHANVKVVAVGGGYAYGAFVREFLSAVGGEPAFILHVHGEHYAAYIGAVGGHVEGAARIVRAAGLLPRGGGHGVVRAYGGLLLVEHGIWDVHQHEHALFGVDLLREGRQAQREHDYQRQQFSHGEPPFCGRANAVS